LALPSLRRQQRYVRESELNMTFRELKPNIYPVGAVDWERRLFDSLIPLPDGTSYNSYLIKGSEKIALIDTVDPTKTQVLEENLAKLGIIKIDFVIANHAEQDHSGSLAFVVQKYGAKVVSTPKAKPMLVDLLELSEEQFITVEDTETISLGGKTLQFIHVPWVHWPETMVTYLKEEKILFSCDFFGSHIAASNLYADDEGKVYEAAKRYFAEIMMPFRNVIQKNLEKLKDYQIDIIAPSHGPVHKQPDFIVNAYRDWVFGEPKNIVVLPYVSMHGSTKKMVDYFAAALIERGVEVELFDLTVTDLGKLALSLVDASTVVLATPTVLAGAHPQIIYATFLANALRPKLKYASVIGSYGWGGKAIEQISGLIPNLKVEVIEPVLAKGYPGEADFKALDNLAQTISDKHKELADG